MHILFAGEVMQGNRQRGFQRLRALESLGHKVTVVPLDNKEERPFSIQERIAWKLGRPKDNAHANEALLSVIPGSTRNPASKFDLIWIEKGNVVRRETVESLRSKLPGAKFVSLSEDDMYARHNHSRYYVESLPLFDLVVTKKNYNLTELKSLGAKQTLLIVDAYDPELHRPLALPLGDRERYGASVAFIGTFEKERARSIKFLADHGIRISIWGEGWNLWRGVHKNIHIRDGGVYGEEYVKALNATKINLCFLRKLNRDETTSRSVEIPACGAFMLGERTARHQELFQGGKEAEFFSSDAELLEKTRHYLVHDHDRKKIAVAGRARCESSGYDHATQLKRVLDGLK